MILKAEALSPAQKSVIEEILGRQILEAEAVSLRAFEPPTPDLQVRQAAVEKLRRFLEETDRPSAGVSDEECEAALLEAIRNERPHYAQTP
jgi:DNA-binding GntR family transcriptional regulator